MDIEVSSRNHDELPNAKPVFSEELIPIRLFMMTSKHGQENTLKTIEAKIKEMHEKTGIPIEKIREVIPKGMLGKGDSEEYHTIAVARDKNERLSVYVSQAHTLTTLADFHFMGVKLFVSNNEVVEMSDGAMESLGKGGEDVPLALKEEALLASVKMTELNISHSKEWKGKREEPLIFEAETYKELLAKLDEKGQKEHFFRMYPDAITDENPLAKVTRESPIKIISPKTRKLLVKRFGLKRIKEVEANIKKQHNDKINKKGKNK